MRQKQKQKLIPKKKKTTSTSQKTSIEKDFDKFRHEIYKFGLSGLDKKEQLDARVELAIKLGAQPKKWIRNSAGLGGDKNKQTNKLQQQQNGKTGEIDKYIKINPSSST